jgi:hypothetical protein
MQERATRASVEALKAAAKARKGEFGGHLLALEAMAHDAGYAGWPAYVRAAEEDHRMTDAKHLDTPHVLEACATALRVLAGTLSPPHERCGYRRVGRGDAFAIAGEFRRPLEGSERRPGGDALGSDESFRAALEAVVHHPAFAQGPGDHDFYVFNMYARVLTVDGVRRPHGAVHVRQQGGVYWDTIAWPEGVVHAMYPQGVPLPEDAVRRRDWAAVHAVARRQRRDEGIPGDLRFDPVDWGFDYAGMAAADATNAMVPVLAFQPRDATPDHGRDAIARALRA